MSEPRDGTDELDPSLEEWLAEVRELEGAAGADPATVEAMLGRVEGDIADAEKRASFRLKTQPTWVRRAIAGAAALAVAIVGGAVALRPDFADAPPLPMALAVGSLALLLGLSLHQALRPLHRPPLSPMARAGIVGLTLACTLSIALLSPHGPPPEGAPDDLLAHVSPCLFYGLLMGVPVFLLLRLLDRGGVAGALLAACAAGLLGNLTLQLHCPRSDLEHLMLAHFGVVVLFVGGLGAVHLLLRRARG